MVKLLHGDGTIVLGGVPIQLDGRFAHADLLELNPVWLFDDLTGNISPQSR